MSNKPIHNGADYPLAKVAWTTVVILSLTYMFSFMGRQILILLIEPIKAEMAVGVGMSLVLGGVVIGFVAGVDSLVLPLFGEIRSWQVVLVLVGVLTLLVISRPLPAPFSGWWASPCSICSHSSSG